MRMSVLSRAPDGQGFYYGFLPGDSRQINVRYEFTGVCQPMRYFAYVGSVELSVGYFSKEAAEAAAIEWIRKNPEGR
jgi:hypothetical protein